MEEQSAERWLPTDESPLSRWGSIRLAGWRGARLRKLPVKESARALRRQLRGERRRAVAESIVARWIAERRSATELSLPDLETLLELERELRPNEPWCAVDLEIDSDRRITEVGFAVLSGGEWLVATGSEADLDVLGVITADRWLIAHNGNDHDYPILERSGVTLPSMRTDSLRWAWALWPSLPSHALGALAETAPDVYFEPERLHHAGEDARVLALVWMHLLHEFHALPLSTRSELFRSLRSIEDPELLRAALGDPSGEWEPPIDRWRTPGSAGPVKPTVRTRTDRSEAIDGALVVVADLRKEFSPPAGNGLHCRGVEVLDHSTVMHAGPSWARAVAVRLIEDADGAISLGPPSMRPLLRNWSRGPDAFEIHGSPILTDRLTATLRPIGRPLVLRDGLSCLIDLVDTGVSIQQHLVSVDEDFIDLVDSVLDEPSSMFQALCQEVAGDLDLEAMLQERRGVLVRVDDGWRWMLSFPDPAAHQHGAVLELAGPVGGHRSAALWRELLGDEVQIQGPRSMTRSWMRLVGLARAGARTAGRRTTVALSLAAAWQGDGKSALVVDRPLPRRVVSDVARSVYWERTGRHLLRPPQWPTVDEARRRLRSPHVALVGFGGARHLGEEVDDVLIVQPEVASSRSPVVERMLETANQRQIDTGVGDPFGDVIEPLSAHLTAELFASLKRPNVWLGESGLLDGLLPELVGTGEAIHIDELRCDIELRSEVLQRLISSGTSRTVGHTARATAIRRLIGTDGSLRDFQLEIVGDVLDGRDVLAVFRTGLGKSLCYQVPAVALGSSDVVTLVISPLLALQRDQVDALRRRGVHEATLYNSELVPEIRTAIRRGIAAGYYTTIFLAPEALWGEAIKRVLTEVDIGLIAIDEAHCVSEMGHDFRPDYRTIPLAIKRILGVSDDAAMPTEGSRPTLLALTGTATPMVRDDIIEALS